MINSSDSGMIQILLVEDNPAEARLLREALKDVASDRFKVEHAERLGDAFACLGRASFDVVLLDLSLPDAKGLDTLQRMREKAPGLAIVVLSGLNDDVVALQAVQSGAQDYLVKGQADGPLLFRAIRYAIERQRTEEELHRSHDLLEARVRERTAELERANQDLVGEIAERKIAEDQVRNLNEQVELRLHRIAALRQIDRAISASLDFRFTVDILLGQLTSQFHVDAAAVLLSNPYSNVLEYSAGTGFRTQGITRSRVRLGEGWAGKAAMKRCVVNVPNMSESREPFERAELLAGEGFKSYYAVPMMSRGQVKGILEIFHRATLAPETEFRDFIETLAGQAAVAIDNAMLWEDTQRTNAELSVAYEATIEGWARLLDLRDKETEGHTQRVTDMTMRLARKMGVGEAELVHVRRGALLHDIGKMVIPDSILQKVEALTPEEWAILKRHPDNAHELLSPISFLRPALDIPYCHHEKWDGTGYPRGIAKERIPLSARIFAAVDIWDALRFDRPYRKGWPEEKVIDHIRSLSGTHLDPKVVEIFLKTLAEGEEALQEEAGLDMDFSLLLN